MDEEVEGSNLGKGKNYYEFYEFPIKIVKEVEGSNLGEGKKKNEFSKLSS